MNKSALHTSVCDMFGIEYPIFSAGMGGTVSPAGPELAAAVSNTDSLGVGMIKAIRPAAEVLQSIADQATEILEQGILN